MKKVAVIPSHKISFFLQVTGFLFFSVLFYFSCKFYLERMLSAGATYYVFQIIQSGSLTSNMGRCGEYIFQLLPWLAVKMQLSLKTILISYSISFILFHYFIFLFITLVLKNNGAGIALLIASCLSYYYAFYTPNMELQECIVLGILLWAIIHPENPYPLKQKNWATIGAIATIVAMSLFHPMGIVLAAFVLGLEIVGEKRYNDDQLWMIAGIGLCWYVLMYYTLMELPNPQEVFRTFDYAKYNVSSVRHWLSTKYFDNISYLHFSYLKWVVVILFILSFRKGTFTFLFVCGYIGIVTLLFLGNFRSGASPEVFENYFTVYGFFAGIIFVFLLYQPRRKNLVLLVTIPFLFNGLYKIYNAHDLLTQKVNYINRLVEDAHKRGLKKCIVDSKCYPYDIAWDSWNMAFETLTYSSLKSPDSSVSVFVRIPGFERLCDSMQNINGTFLATRSEPTWYTTYQMPPKYFNLPPTPYSYLTNAQDVKNFNESSFASNNIKIKPQDIDVISEFNNWIITVPLQILNTGQTIPAMPRKLFPVYLTYSIYDEKGSLIQVPVKQPLEADVEANSSSIEGMIVFCPHLKGTYYIQPDIITEGIGAWNIPSQRIKLTVR
jgi:hypothetical protein